MAQFNITLNQEEILQLLLEDRGDAFKSILQASLNKILQVESSEQLKAAPYERSEDRTDSRNGTRERELNTRIGRIVLHVPRHRNVWSCIIKVQSLNILKDGKIPSGRW